jgi:hypothetical protein
MTDDADDAEARVAALARWSLRIGASCRVTALTKG